MQPLSSQAISSTNLTWCFSLQSSWQWSSQQLATTKARTRLSPWLCWEYMQKTNSLVKWEPVSTTRCKCWCNTHSWTLMKLLFTICVIWYNVTEYKANGINASRFQTRVSKCVYGCVYYCWTGYDINLFRLLD